jgi:hypothetical protein
VAQRAGRSDDRFTNGRGPGHGVVDEGHIGRYY